MNPNPNRFGIILAAGASRRMGREKALLPWNGGTLLSTGIAALQPVCAAVLVIAGPHNAAALEPVAAAAGARLIVNPAPERGQLSSLQTGLAAATAADSVAWTPVDCPPLLPATLDRLAAAFAVAMAAGAWALAPEHAGRRGHPLFATRELVAALLAAPSSGSARDVLQSRPERLTAIVVPEPWPALEMNAPSEYAQLTRMLLTWS